MKDKSLQHYDLIGDIHGELCALERLLAKLGYREEGGGMEHPEGRKLIFLGDFIDRGPESRGVLHLVRRLVDSGVALAIMGNHEFNFIAYHTQDEKDRYLRRHSDNHTKQVAETLQSFEGHEDEIPDWVEWMKALPMFLELDGLRAVHASWVAEDIAYLADKSLLDRDFLIEANRRGTRAWHTTGRILKAAELTMPNGIKIADSNGIERSTMRVRWWGDLAGLTWSEVAFPRVADLPEGKAELDGLDEILSYGPDDPPVFFGHYKLIGYPVGPQSGNVASLDYGLGHGGPATAYRWSGEKVIMPENFVQVGRLSDTIPKAPNSDTTVLLIRHGESEANAGLPTPSPAAIRLTEKGRTQARDLAESFDFEPGLVIVSPYIRTRETAGPLLAKFPGTPVEEWPIQEFTYLDTARFAGTTEAERRAEVEDYWNRDDAFTSFGDGAESFAHFIGRVEAMISRIKETKRGCVIAVFTHGYVINAAGLLLREPDTPVDSRMMRGFRTSWVADAPDHCEVRRFRIAN